MEKLMLDEDALLELRKDFMEKHHERYKMWRDSHGAMAPLPIHQDQATGVCTWLDRKQRRAIIERELDKIRHK